MLLTTGLESWGLLVLRVFLGLIFLYHSVPKLIASGKMAKGMGWSSSSVFLLGFIEFISSLALIFGFYAEIGALLVGLVMLGAIYYKVFKWKVPFSAMDKMGWEFDLILLGAAVAVLFLGAGAISLDFLFGFWS